MIPQIESGYVEMIKGLIKNYKTKAIKEQKELLPPIPIHLMHFEECQAAVMMDHYLTKIENIQVKALIEADKKNYHEIGEQKVECDFELNGEVFFVDATIYGFESNYRRATHFQPAESDFQSQIEIDRIVTFDDEDDEIFIDLG